MRFPVILIIICYFLLIASDLVIINDLKVMSLYDKFKPKHKKVGIWWKVYSIFAVLIVALLTVAVCMPKRNAAVGVTPTMWMLYIVITIEIAQCIYSSFSLIGFIPAIFRRRRWNTGLWVGMPLAVLIFSMMWWGVLIGRNRLSVIEITIESDRLPKSFDGYKIAQISDLHVGTWGNDTTFLYKLVEKVNSLSPDLIVFTGDLVNRESVELEPFIHTLAALNAPDGVLTILGNHDYGDYVSWDTPEDKKNNLDHLKNQESRMGWVLLDNTHKVISNEKNDSIIIIGVGNWGEPPFTKYGDLAKAYPKERFGDKNFKILLSHNPEHWNQEVSKISNIDLTLSGHPHAIQFMFSFGGHRWSPAQYKYKQWSGLYERAGLEGVPSFLYVNIGAGEVGIPMRVGATPEITLFTLHRDSDK